MTGKKERQKREYEKAIELMTEPQEKSRTKMWWKTKFHVRNDFITFQGESSNLTGGSHSENFNNGKKPIHFSHHCRFCFSIGCASSFIQRKDAFSHYFLLPFLVLMLVLSLNCKLLARVFSRYIYVCCFSISPPKENLLLSSMCRSISSSLSLPGWNITSSLFRCNSANQKIMY